MTTKGDLEKVTFLNRPIKPVALGLTVVMTTLAIANILDAGLLGDNALSHTLAVFAVTSAILLTLGWITGKQRIAEIGLLTAAAVNVARSSFLLFTFGPGQQSVWLSLGVTVIAGGAYLLESWDDPERRKVRRLGAE